MPLNTAGGLQGGMKTKNRPACTGWNGIPPNSRPPAPQTVTFFGNKVFSDLFRYDEVTLGWGEL